ncbi:uncharacterized protein L969DRAFT_86426 [Mixia osmundae IAM 14324]|uniref:uncharacterized protein n=1 Tax=Mixia osmundae (strain CBS 9802 / IAM 14324 / JCM 22182 / KY 12970) TaxID=764103 RepID=UPI0004A556CE|nr:uncharacterized protein L969DRAFT_86426 [Mixia osmundae IAM 14324]KEI39838.1 hypothetical protein L969DRAFT_86426 [Mixia osmundae IAM 14324]
MHRPRQLSSALRAQTRHQSTIARMRPPPGYASPARAHLDSDRPALPGAPVEPNYAQPIGPDFRDPTRRKKPVSVISFVLCVSIAIYGALFVDWGPQEHCFSPVRLTHILLDTG